ncbi:hypothetical protein WEN_02070 [Mycoplasma wenyonii str. Massachusetts]|uniref:Uncharacterized protein n=1 Tax=Mycoplasma wenyonii (strain Massachusetts) TaxID=1197325 RepID=I6Z6I2_MYCWM|nr:hypothetical protein WEN_02070 [Mycoplasma wenyonii str. Massachusetts]
MLFNLYLTSSTVISLAIERKGIIQWTKEEKLNNTKKEETKILSAKGSKTAPKLDSHLHFLAKWPSK